MAEARIVPVKIESYVTEYIEAMERAKAAVKRVSEAAQRIALFGNHNEPPKTHGPDCA